MMYVKCNEHNASSNLHNDILIIAMYASEKMLSFIYSYSLEPSCIMVSTVLLRCYQYHRCYDHIWPTNCNVIQRHLYLEGDPYHIFIFQSLQICPFTRYKCVLDMNGTKYKHICNDLSFFLQVDPFYIFILQSLQICNALALGILSTKILKKPF